MIEDNFTSEQIEEFYNCGIKEGLTVKEILFQFFVTGITEEQYTKWVEEFHQDND
jgi:hypothetical protein